MIRTLTTLSLLLLVSPVAHAGPSKTECKEHASSVKQLGKELGLSDEITGRELMNTVQGWTGNQDDATIKRVIDGVEEAAAGVKACEASGLANTVRAVKGMSMKLESVLPWLRNAAAVDPCQALTNQAVRKKAGDLDGAIEDMERSVRECQDVTWLPEAHRTLAAMYYERGDVERGDYEHAHDQMRQALEVGAGPDEESREAFRAVLARSAIESGKGLMERQAYETAKVHWEAYIRIFGTPDFDVLFDVEQIARDAWQLRELRDARHQLSLACIELGDLACTEAVLSKATDYDDDVRPIRELTTRAFELAEEATAEQREASYALAFDLLTVWNEADPDSFQVTKLLEDTLLAQPRDERLQLLRSTDKCWIPMRAAETLKRNGEHYVEEVEIALACGGSGAQAQQMLNELHLQAARDKLDRLGAARTVQEKRTVIRELEEQLLPKVTDPAEAEKIRAALADARARLQDEAAEDRQQTVQTYAACTDLLATIQWNMAREKDYDRLELDFKVGCCATLRSATEGWVSWMGSRLGEAEVENKKRLMKGYCERGH